MGMFSGLAQMLGGGQVVPGLGQMYEKPGLMGQLGNFIEKNPEQFWMMLDGAGQMFDPNNPAAGIGTSVSQANLMNKEQKAIDQQTNKKQSPLLSMLGDAVSGKMTAPEVAGPTKYTSTINPDGTMTHKFDVTPRGVVDQQSPQSLGQQIDNPIGYNLGPTNPQWPRR